MIYFKTNGTKQKTVEDKDCHLEEFENQDLFIRKECHMTNFIEIIESGHTRCYELY